MCGRCGCGRCGCGTCGRGMFGMWGFGTCGFGTCGICGMCGRGTCGRCGRRRGRLPSCRHKRTANPASPNATTSKINRDVFCTFEDASICVTAPGSAVIVFGF